MSQGEILVQRKIQNCLLQRQQHLAESTTTGRSGHGHSRSYLLPNESPPAPGLRRTEDQHDPAYFAVLAREQEQLIQKLYSQLEERDKIIAEQQEEIRRWKDEAAHCKAAASKSSSAQPLRSRDLDETESEEARLQRTLLESVRARYLQRLR